MSTPWQYALTVGPLGFYLWVLAVWQSDGRPRVVRGPVDFGMLAFGVGGLLAFGPIGQWASRMVFAQQNAAGRLAAASALGLWACVLARRSSRRLVVYHVDDGRLARALADALSGSPGEFRPIFGGFEDRENARGLRVEPAGWLGCATVEAYGRDPVGLIREVRPRLCRSLLADAPPGPPSRLARPLYLGSVLVMLIPLAAQFLEGRHARQAVRLLLDRLRGG